MTVSSLPIPVPSVEAVPGRVLVVDDDASVRRIVSRILARQGHTVETAAGVGEALSRLDTDDFDAALIDLDMPERNGLELLAEMKRRGSRAIAVLLTGTTDIKAAVGGMKQGAFDYLPKPPEAETIGWTVARAIDVGRARCRARVLEGAVAEWALTFDACPDLLIVLDGEGRLVRANEAVSRSTRRTPPQLIGRHVTDVFPGELGRAIVERNRRPGEASPAATLSDSVLGGHFLLSTNPIPAAGPSHAGLVVVARDVTRLLEAEQERARLFQRVLTTQEDERGRIARELHDGIGQALVSLSIGLAAVNESNLDAGVGDQVRRLARIATESVDEIRRLAQDLRPTVLDDLGLTAALSRLADVFTHVHGVRAELLVPDGPVVRLPRPLESAVYRITQEALNNVAKHARARTVDVILEVEEAEVRVSVSDDGAGFPPANPARRYAGFGLSGMRERAVMLGGTFRIDSVEGEGTTIEVKIPVPKEAA